MIDVKLVFSNDAAVHVQLPAVPRSEERVRYGQDGHAYKVHKVEFVANSDVVEVYLTGHMVDGRHQEQVIPPFSLR